jgi:chemotaxis signal transduction protein
LSDPGTSILASVTQLRRSFDESFSVPARERAEDGQDLLVIGVGEDRYALRVAELTAVDLRRKIVPLPSGRPEFLGLAGIAGRLVPAYSLGVLLGHGREPQAPWLAVCGREQPVGLAFSQLHGHVSVRPDQLHVQPAGGQIRPHVREAIHWAEGSIFVLDIPSIVAAALPPDVATECATQNR